MVFDTLNSFCFRCMCWNRSGGGFTIDACRRISAAVQHADAADSIVSISGREENNNEMVASVRGSGGVGLRLFHPRAGNHIEGASSTAVDVDRAPEGTGTLVRENHRRIEGPHQMPDLSVDATRRLRSATLRPGQGRGSRCDLDGRGLLRGPLSAGGGLRTAVLHA